MCLSTIYSGKEINDEKILCEYVTEIEINEYNLKVIDITGNMTEYNGIINKIDLIRNSIFIDLD